MKSKPHRVQTDPGNLYYLLDSMYGKEARKFIRKNPHCFKDFIERAPDQISKTT